jgi:hypothetical protein
MKAIELSPSGATIIDEKPAPKISETGVHIIREPKDLYLWAGAQFPSIDESEAVTDVADLPKADTKIQFAILREPAVKVIQPIPVELKHEGDSVVASWQETDEYGYGLDRSEALEDFGRTVSQLFVSLSRDESVLGNDMQRVLAVLRKHLRFR